MNEMARKGELTWRVRFAVATVVLASSPSMDQLEYRALKYNRILTSLVGIWHSQTYRERLLRCCIVSFVYLCGVFGQLCPFFTLDVNLRNTTMVLQLFIPTICFASIYFTAILHYGTLQKLYKCIIEDCHALQNDVEKKIVRRYVHESQIFLFLLTSMLGIFFGALIFPRVLHRTSSVEKNNKQDFPFPVHTCYDHFLDPGTHYFYVVAYQSVIIFTTITGALACYTLYFSFIQHGCARFSIAISRIREPFENDHYKDHVFRKPKDFSNWMIDIIKYLAKTVEYVNLINTTSENCYLFQVFLAMMFLVIDILSLFQIPYLLEDESYKNDIPVFLFFVIGSLFPVYINCHIGQRLMDCSMDVYKEACVIPIDKIPLETQKLLLTMLMITSKPCTISIGKLFVSSHEFFSHLLRTSLSFAMVLHSLQTI